MLSGDNINLKIPASHAVVVGFNGQKTRGFMTHYTEDAAGKKRISTQESRAKYFTGHAQRDKIETKIIDNKPMSGFKFGNVEYFDSEFRWAVEDPRGFTMFVTSVNANQIIGMVSTENGEILERCVWGNIGAENVLIPISSQAYKAAQENTTRVSTRVNLRSVKLGSKILTHDAVEGIYLGGMYGLTKINYSSPSPKAYSFSPKRFLVAETKTDGTWKNIHVYSEIKVSKVLEDGDMDPALAEAKVNANLHICKTHIGYGRPDFFISKKPKDAETFQVQYELEAKTRDELLKAIENNHYLKVIAETTDGQMLSVSGYTYAEAIKSTHAFNTTLVDRNDWETNQNISYVQQARSSSSGWYSHYRDNVNVSVDPTDQSIKLFCVVLTAKTELGNDIRIIT